jgi:cytochrome c nitrite reductase small subunit
MPSFAGIRPQIVLGVAVGAMVGLGLYTYVYAHGASYLTNDPSACANCHVMNEQYGGWLKSSHHAAAVCNDCHTPHDFVGKYTTKALNGFWHSFAFTSGRFPDAIRITDRNHAIVENACRSCHGEIVQAIDLSQEALSSLSCVRCHSAVGHGP